MIRARLFMFPVALTVLSLMAACAQDPSGSKKLNRTRLGKVDRSNEMAALLGESFSNYKQDDEANLEFVKKVEGASAIVEATLLEDESKAKGDENVAKVQIAFLVTGVVEPIEATGSVGATKKVATQMEVKGDKQERFKVAARCKSRQIEVFDEASESKVKKVTDPCATLITLLTEIDPASQKVVGNAAMVFMHTAESLEAAKKTGEVPTVMELVWIAGSQPGTWDSGPRASLEAAKRQRAGKDEKLEDNPTLAGGVVIAPSSEMIEAARQALNEAEAALAAAQSPEEMEAAKEAKAKAWAAYEEAMKANGTPVVPKAINGDRKSVV